MGDHPLQLTSRRIAGLKALKDADKFVPVPGVFYPGAPSEDIRAQCEARLDEMIDRLLVQLEADPRKAVALEEFAKILADFAAYDSEERDRVCSYLEQIMGILGIDSSDGLLNTWRYGFDLTEGGR